MVDYIKMVYRDHLNDTFTYTFVPEPAVPEAVAHIKRELLTWIKYWKEILTKHESGKLRKLASQNERKPLSHFLCHAQIPQDTTQNATHQLLQRQSTLRVRHLGQ
jgi:hypothetical protein